MLQERVGRLVNQRPPRNFAASGGAHPFGLHQHVERALGGLNPADRLDFGAADGLVIGDDRQHLGGGTRQFARVVAFAAQKMRKVARRMAMPMPAAPDKLDPADRATQRDSSEEHTSETQSLMSTPYTGVRWATKKQ